MRLFSTEGFTTFNNLLSFFFYEFARACQSHKNTMKTMILCSFKCACQMHMKSVLLNMQWYFLLPAPLQ